MIVQQIVAIMPYMMILGFVVAAPVIFYGFYKALDFIGLVNNVKTNNWDTGLR